DALASAFLSCLYGSEGEHRPTDNRGTFLSCLYGSEVGQDGANGLIVKAASFFPGDLPFFRGHL
ncbi:MAG TPA: hypothetical protein VN156_08745, partial [Pseudomonas sp.]|nr:hypothetical protein [Pseudomonas sp.]